MNYQEIIDELKKQDIDAEKLDELGDGKGSDFSIQEIGEVEIVDDYGGEGEGDTLYNVFFFKDHNIYIQINGFYSSYDGCDWSYATWREVKPVEKLVTVYESIK